MTNKEKIDGWFLQRNNLHFDTPLTFNKANLLVKNSGMVSKHSFLPFLTFDVETIKYKKTTDTKDKERVFKKRQICYASHVDGYIYSYYASQLSKLYEKKLIELSISESVLAFRKIDGKSNIHFAKQAFNDISSKVDCTAIALDFSKFFDNLDQNILKNEWCKLLSMDSLPKDHFNIYKSLTKYSTVNKDKVYKLFNISKNNPKNRPFKICSIKEFREKVRNENNLIQPNPTINDNKGIPQGSSLSALLSNIYMLDFDKKMLEFIKSLDRLGKYYRYCDDILIVVDSSTVEEIEVFVENLVKDFKLEFNASKTIKSNFKKNNGVIYCDKDLQYLGFMFDGQNIYLRSASISRYHQKFKKSLSLSQKTMDKYNEIRNMKDLESKPLYKRKLYEKYSHLGKTNFITYGLRAKDIMQSVSIKKQIKKLNDKLNKELSEC